jgi:hypothetical protein
MSEHMLLVLEDEEAHGAQSPKAMAELIDARAQFADSLRSSGHLRDCGRLRPSKEGKRVRRAGDALEVRGGPFPEGGKALGAYYWVDAPSVEDATRLASACPVLATDTIDVRPLRKGKAQADKDGKPGKVFAFAVLGSAATEEGWERVMDRIDAETHDGFPSGAFLGGLRLEPPKRGKRVAAQGERRAMVDGPFLESKEVIGGVFFLRATSIDEAVAWAGETRFVVHGALEIRELWRC